MKIFGEGVSWKQVVVASIHSPSMCPDYIMDFPEIVFDQRLLKAVEQSVFPTEEVNPNFYRGANLPANSVLTATSEKRTFFICVFTR